MHDPVTLSEKQFTDNKALILAKLRKEAEENVLKEKVLASINDPTSVETQSEFSIQGKVRRLPPQQCVILKPVLKESSFESHAKIEEANRAPPPIIIPGNPEKSMKLLQNQEARDLIQKEIEKHNEQRYPLDDDAQTKIDDKTNKNNEEETNAIILTSLATFDDHGTKPTRRDVGIFGKVAI